MRRAVVGLLVGALTSMGLGAAASGATSNDAPVAAESVATTAPAAAPGGIQCTTITPASRGPMEICDHGPDVVPDLDLSLPIESYPQYTPPALEPQATPGIECYGDGVSGIRVQPVYVVPAGVSPVAGRMNQIKSYAADVEDEVSNSAQQTDGARHVRWVTDTACELQVLTVTLTTASVASLSANANEMINLGHDRTDRIYLMWVEAAIGVCGIGQVFTVDTPTSLNPNTYGPRYTRVDVPCFGLAETHELGHNMGAVQASAPHSTPAGHCTDEWDIMCYDDDQSGPVVMDFSNASGPCPGTPDVGGTGGNPGTPGTGHNRIYDCNNDDYFHTNAPPGSYLATHWNIANHPVLAHTTSTGPTGAGAYHSLTRPVRIVDTRFANAPDIWGLPSTLSSRYAPTSPSSMVIRPTRLTPNRSYVSKLTGFDSPSGNPTFPQTPFVSEAGVPNVGVAAVVLTVTVIDPSTAGFLSIRPFVPSTFGAPFSISNINYAAGQVIPNTVTITVPAHGLVEVYSSAGSPFVIFDVAGWFADASGTHIEKGAYHALTPSRIMNTRTGLGGSTTLGPNTTVNLKVTGGSVDATHGAAVVLNVTAAETTAPSYFTVWPKGEARPVASNVNFPPGGAAANLVVVGVGADGSISIYLEAGNANVIVDLLGWFDGGGPGAPAGATYHAITPHRFVDTRSIQTPKMASEETRAFLLRASAGVPNDASVTAVVANVAAVEPAGGGYLTTFPTGGARPDTSSVNFVPDQNRANLAFMTLSNAGQSSVFAFGAPTHVLIDVAGYFST